MSLAPYSFHHSRGRSATLSCSNTTAERNNPRTDYNNAVVISAAPLKDGRALSVKIDKKVSTWSGSILIGATVEQPENLNFPASLTNFSRPGSWVFNGKTLWKDGAKVSHNYGSKLFDSLPEGSTVGVLRRGSSLHFLVNDTDQGIAERNLPAGSVYALVDIYGQCAKVSIVRSVSFGEASGADSVTVSGDTTMATREQNASGSRTVQGELLFHEICGRLVKLSGNGKEAFRTKADLEFNNGVVLTRRPLVGDELLEVVITEMKSRWSGSIEIGVTTHSPESLSFPSTMTNMHSGTWMMSGNGIIVDGAATINSYGTNLDSLKCGDTVGVMRRRNGTLVFVVNGEEMGVAASNVPQNVYGVIDLYGRCSGVKMCSSSSDVDDNEEELVSSLGQVSQDQLEESLQLCFHEVCGEHAVLSSDMRTARRDNPDNEFTRATVFTQRPLRRGELFQITIDEFVDTWSGSVQMGVCKASPVDLDLDEIDEISDYEDSTWVLTGSELYCAGSPIEVNYPLDLDSVGVGARVGVMVRNNGELHFYLNGEDMGCATRDVSNDVYGVLDIYGQCSQVTIVQGSRVTPTQNPILSPSTPSLLDTTTPTSPSDNSISCGKAGNITFHSHCGSNVVLLEGCLTATRVSGYRGGVVFSSSALSIGDVCQVKLTELTMKPWQGHLRVGLVSFNPSLLSQCISIESIQLPSDTWMVSGRSVLHNGVIISECYGRRQLCRLQVGDTIGVWHSLDGSMHVSVNCHDLGPAVYGLPEETFAVFELYGRAKSVHMMCRSPQHQTPHSEYQEDNSHSDMDSNHITLSSHYGQHIKLSGDYKRAWRAKSYNFGLVISSLPLPSNCLFQFEILETVDWSGSLKVGVTGLTPECACGIETASQLRDHSYILGSCDGVSQLYVGGMEVLSIPQLGDIASLGVGSVIGVLITSRTCLHFFVDQSHIQIELPHNLKLPRQRYALVDIYGKCSKIQLYPVTHIKDTELSEPTYTLKIPYEALSNGLYTQVLTSKKNVSKKKEPHVTGSKVKHNALQPVSPSNNACDSSTLHTNAEVACTDSLNCDQHMETIVDSHQPSLKVCEYQILCENFLRSLNLPDSYFDKRYNKCYCKSCSTSRRDPPVKFHGHPPSKYSVPLGWVQFGLKLNLFHPEAQDHDLFTKLHKAYHGTSVENVLSILDAGRLLLPGTPTPGHGFVTRPEGHFNEIWKPAEFDPNQIFMSPSIKYCTQHEVFSKRYSYTDPLSKECHHVKVCFKLLVEPGCYSIARQTVLRDQSIVDGQFSNDQLEWSTGRYESVYLYCLMVHIDRVRRT